MNSIDFGKKCRQYNIKYRELFGYVPCRDDYQCSQQEYFDALIKAIKDNTELSELLKKKEFNEVNLSKRY